MSAQSPHLTLPELAAAESTGPLAAATAAHLEGCAPCQARSRDLAVDGIHFLVARCQPPPGLMRHVFEAIDAEPAGPRRDRLPGGDRAGGGHAVWGRGALTRLGRRAPGRTWRLAAAGLAAAVTAGVITAQVLAPGGARPADSIAVRELAYRAAAAAAAEPLVRPSQWVYWQEKAVAAPLPQMPGSGTNAVFHVWTTADSRKAAWVYRGKIVSLGKGPFLGQPLPSPDRHGGWSVTSAEGKIPVSYAGLASLPHDPEALDRYLGHLNLRGWGPAPFREFMVIEDLLTSYVMPPRLTAELYRALGDIPGVTADPHAVDVAGRPGAAFRIAVPPWAGGGIQEIIVDPHTFHLMGTDLIENAPAADRGTVLTGMAILHMALVSGPGVRP
jgi:hypothetical protein